MLPPPKIGYHLRNAHHEPNKAVLRHKLCSISALFGRREWRPERDAIGAVNGLVITNNSGPPTTAIDIATADAILIDTSGTSIRTGTVNLTINAIGNGANGLDAGSLADYTWCYIWLISNGTTTAGLLSASATSPTMPSGYTYKYRVEAIRTGGSATFDRIIQKENRAQYKIVSGSTTTAYPTMASGSTGGSSTFSAVSVSNYVPTTAVKIALALETDSAVAQVTPNSNATNPAFYKLEDVSNHIEPLEMMLESMNIYWASNSANGELYAHGWVDAVNAN